MVEHEKQEKKTEPCLVHMLDNPLLPPAPNSSFVWRVDSCDPVTQKCCRKGCCGLSDKKPEGLECHVGIYNDSALSFLDYHKFGNIEYCDPKTQKCCRFGCCSLEIGRLLEKLATTKAPLGIEETTRRNIDVVPKKKSDDSWVYFVMTVVVAAHICFLILIVCANSKCRKNPDDPHRQIRRGPHVSSALINTQNTETQAEIAPISNTSQNQEIELTEVNERVPSAPPHAQLNIGFALDRNDDHRVPPNAVLQTPPPCYEEALLAPSFRPEDRIPSYEDVSKGKIT